jgi:hypothetical protein
MTRHTSSGLIARWLAVLGVGGLALAWGGPVQAGIITLTDHETKVVLDDSSSRGIHEFSLSGTNTLYQEWFWFRTAGMNKEQALNAATLTGSQQVDARSWNGTYSDGQTWEVEVYLAVTGGVCCPIGDLAESITIRNLSTTDPLRFTFIEYTDWDLSSDADSDTSVVLASTPIPGFAVVQQDGPTGYSRTSIVSPTSLSRYELSTYANTLNKLNDGAVDDLASPFPPPGNMAMLTGPADLTWAVQWDLNLAPGTSYIISKDKLVVGVPEPSTLGLLILVAPPALAVHAWRRGGRRASS